MGASSPVETGTCSWLRDSLSSFDKDNPDSEEYEYETHTHIHTHTTHFCAPSVQVYGYTAALFDALDALLLGGWLLVRTVQSKRHGGETLRLAKRAGLEGTFLPADVPGDVEGVALSVTEAVDDGAADAALLVDGLL